MASNTNVSPPICIESVLIHNVSRSRDYILRRNVSRFLKCANVREFIDEFELANATFKKLGMLSKCEALIDRVPGKRNTFELALYCREVSLITGGVGAQAYSNKCAMNVGGGLRNPLGIADNLRISLDINMFSFSHDSSFNKWGLSNTDVLYRSALTGDPNITLDVGFATNYDFFPWNKTKERNIGPFIGLNFPSPLGLHSLSWSGKWRYMTGEGQPISLAMREHFGHDLKSSICHSLIIDRMNRPAAATASSKFRGSPLPPTSLPYSGAYFKWDEEVAGIGLGGNIRFIKHQAEAQFAHTFFDYITLSLGSSCGFLHGGPGATVGLSDRFYLGGPANLRGFLLNTVSPTSPKVNYDALGGNTFYGLAVHLYSRLPFISRPRPSDDDSFSFYHNVRPQLFFNMGTAAFCSLDKGLQVVSQELWQETRSSYGVGIASGFGPIRFEVNYVFPFHTQPNDKFTGGFQLGCGFNFL